MRQRLTIHPDFACPAVTSIEADAARPSAGVLTLTYRLTGALAELRLPPPAAPARADELWRHSCFEAFVRPAPGDGYLEFNLAPSTQWAAYRFSGYREGMAAADIAAPRTAVRTDDGRFELEVALDLPADLAGAPWRLALSAVIEDASGARSYWALAHPPGRPDFHHAAGFILDLPPPERP